MQYRAEIDGLRALAVLPVILFHGGFPGFEGGFVGVDVFFVISGYLITSILLNDLAQGRFSILRFYERRARRILPALFFVMAACVPMGLMWMLPGELRLFGQNSIAVSLFASNILFWRTTNYFSPRSEDNPLLHTWSLAVEEQFYIFFPLMLWLIWRFGPRSLIAMIVVTALISLGISEWGWRNSPTANFYLLPTRAWELMAGSLCAVALQTRKVGNNQGLALLGMGMVLAAMAFFDEGTPFPSLYGLLPVVGVVLIILCAGPQTWVGRALSTKVIVGIGLISYSAYLWHQPLFAFARLHAESGPPLWVMGTLALLSLVLAVFSWKFVEQPFRHRDGGVLPTQRSVFVASGAGLLGFIALGSALFFSNGWLTRYAPEDRPLVSINFAEQGRYVWTRFEKHLLKPFPDNTRQNVLIIGDSYGQDFINAIYEADLQDTVNLSTHLILTDCGNLLLTRDMTPLLRAKDRDICARRPRYDTPRLQPLLNNADVIFLVSSWRAWQLPYLEESLANIKKRTNARIVVVGRKSFGRLRPKDILKVPAADRPSLTSPVSEAHLSINAQMVAQNIPYMNLHDILCDGKTACPIISSKGELFSYDGGHLTRAGARFMGQALKDKSVIFQQVFTPPAAE